MVMYPPRLVTERSLSSFKRLSSKLSILNIFLPSLVLDILFFMKVKFLFKKIGDIRFLVLRYR